MKMACDLACAAKLLSVFVLGAIFLPQSAHADDKLYDLVRRGYQFVYDEGYTQIEECTPDKPVTIGQYIFICSGYNYAYHYGGAMLLAKEFIHEGKKLYDVHLCLEDEDECFDGQVLRR